MSEGDLNDHTGKGPLGGKTTACALNEVIHVFEENTTIGNAVPHGVISGKVHTNGTVGEWPRAWNSGADVAAEGTGDYGREHTIGGMASTTGKIGCNPVVGTLGGAVHTSDPDENNSNTETASVMIDPNDIEYDITKCTS